MMARLKFMLIMVCLVLGASPAFAFSIEDSWLLSTAFITRVHGTVVTSGTGFFVFRQIDEKSGRLFLVSNKHVLIPEPTSSGAPVEAVATIYITVDKDGELSVSSFTLPLRAKDGSPLWTGHPSADVDVVVIEVTPFVSAGGS